MNGKIPVSKINYDNESGPEMTFRSTSVGLNNVSNCFTQSIYFISATNVKGYGYRINSDGTMPSTTFRLEVYGIK